MTCVVQLAAPWREPAEVLSAFAGEPWALGLVTGGVEARWSYVARAPSATLTHRAGEAGQPFARLRDLLGPPAAPATDGPPFQGGVVGLAAYELGDHVEALGLARQPDWPDLAAARYDALLAFDRPAAVARAVVHQHKLNVIIDHIHDLLLDVGIQRPQVLLVVIHRHDD